MAQQNGSPENSCCYGLRIVSEGVIRGTRHKTNALAKVEPERLGFGRRACRARMCRKRLEAMPEGADAKTCNAAQSYALCNRPCELERAYAKLP